jgi:hypothetical protein
MVLPAQQRARVLSSEGRVSSTGCSQFNRQLYATGDEPQLIRSHSVRGGLRVNCGLFQSRSPRQSALPTAILSAFQQPQRASRLHKDLRASRKLSIAKSTFQLYRQYLRGHELSKMGPLVPNHQHQCDRGVETNDVPGQPESFCGVRFVERAFWRACSSSRAP